MKPIVTRIELARRAIPPLFVLWTMLMLYLTLSPGEALPDVKLFAYDKLGHFGMFAGWTFFLGLYMIIYKENRNVSLFLLTLAGILFGGLIEILQHVLPGNRNASWGDFAANTLGCIAAYLVLRSIRHYVRGKK